VDRIYCLVRVRGGGLMTRCVHKAAVRARELMSEATAKFHRIADRTGIPAALIKAQGLGANEITTALGIGRASVYRMLGATGRLTLERASSV
jgi:hypothetical protein